MEQDIIPQQMTVIINIQNMSKVSGIEYKFEQLAELTLKELHNLQDSIIPAYNDAIEARKFTADMIYNRK